MPLSVIWLNTKESCSKDGNDVFWNIYAIWSSIKEFSKDKTVKLDRLHLDNI